MQERVDAIGSRQRRPVVAKEHFIELQKAKFRENELIESTDLILDHVEQEVARFFGQIALKFAHELIERFLANVVNFLARDELIIIIIEINKKLDV